MVKIAIADDEKMIREGIFNSFPWKENGFDVIGVCKNGQEAYDLALYEKPDIFLLDINMPILSGLDLIEKIKLLHPDMMFIIITGYSEFEYVHRALQLSVYDFVVKPINEDKLWEVVNKARMDLLAERENKSNNENLRLQLERNKIVLQEEFINHLVTKGYERLEDIKNELKNLKLDFGECPGLVVVRYIAHVSSERKWSEQLFQFALKNLISDLIDSLGKNCTNTVDLKGQVLTLINVKDKKRWLDFSENLELASEKYLGHQIRVESSFVSKDLKNCFEVYKSLDRKLDITLSEYVNAAKKIIEKEYSNNELDLNLVASRLSITSSYLSKKINKELGISFKEYLISIRMEKARDLVTKTEMQFNEIANSIGYSNQHYFTRAFKKYTTLSPSLYRKKYGNFVSNS